jgi:hypothetical protein
MTVPGAVHISQNGILVSGTTTVSGGGETVVFTPSVPWQYGALVQVFLDSTAVDTSGNTVNAYQGSFTTLPDPAITAPGVVNFSPLSSATNVPLNVVMEVGYSETLDAATLNATDVYVQRNNDGSRPAVTISLDSTAALAANTVYCYYVQTGVKGTNGKAAGTFGQCFTTGTSPQTTAPTVLSVSPPDQLANVPVNANIRVLFSGPIDPLTVNSTTIQVSAGGVPITSAISFSTAAQAGVTTQTVSFSNGNQAVLITPENPLPASTVLTLTVSGVKDLAGNVVPTSTTHFTTGTGPDTITPLVVSTNPPASATNVPLNVAVSLQTNVAIDPTTLNSNTFGVYDTVLAVYVSGSYSLSSNGLIVYFVPSAPLATGRIYNVLFNGRGMADLVGNQFAVCCGVNDYHFTTGVVSSTTGPNVTGVSPANGSTQVPLNAQVLIQFNEPVNGQSLSQVTLSAGGSPVQVFRNLTNGNQTLILVPVVTLFSSTVYTVTVTGVTDLSGVIPISPPVSTNFTTGTTVDFLVPTVTSVTPANTAINVARTTSILVQFNKPVDPLTITTGTFIVSVTNGGTVTGTISVAPDGKSAMFTPQSALAPLTNHTVQVTSGVSDLAGQGVVLFQASFTTGS